MTFVTSRDIMKATGIENVATLVRWHKHESLIPPPEIRTHPSGRGKMAYWPEWVLVRCIQIRQLRKQGMNLGKIRDFLGIGLVAAPPPLRRKYCFAEVSRLKDKEAAQDNLSRLFEGSVVKWVKSRCDGVLQSSKSEITPDIVERGIELYEAGCHPVLVVTKDSIYLTADFAVSLYLSRCHSAGQFMVVIPVADELRAFLSELDISLPSYSVEPISKVLRKSESSRVERKCVLLENFEFQIQPDNQCRK